MYIYIYSSGGTSMLQGMLTSNPAAPAIFEGSSQFTGGGELNRTYGTHKKLPVYVTLFLLTILDPIYLWTNTLDSPRKLRGTTSK